jgi:hypothetical protein
LYIALKARGKGHERLIRLNSPRCGEERVMSELTQQADPYLVQWDPRAYLRQYYSTPYLPDDSQAVLQFLIEQLRQRRQTLFDKAIEFGCGPTLYNAMAIAPHVRELHLADYLPANLHEIRHWLDNEPGAHDWRFYVRGILEMETGGPPTDQQVADREAELRRKAAGLHTADIRQRNPLGAPQSFDLVASFFCIEAVSSDHRDWETFMRNLAGLVCPGGRLMLASVRRCNGYEVLGNRFPAAHIDEGDFNLLLPQLGFDANSMIVRAVPITEWVDEGFDSICLVAAESAR